MTRVKRNGELAMRRLTEEIVSVPSEYETLVAQELVPRLAELLSQTEVTFTVNIDNRHQENIQVPCSAIRLLLDILTEMAQGHGVTLIPHHTELTTQQAADFLNVSRPFVVKLIDENKLPAHKIGRHRRVRFEDLLRYKKQMESDRQKALEALTKEAQELGLEY